MKYFLIILIVVAICIIIKENKEKKYYKNKSNEINNITESENKYIYDNIKITDNNKIYPYHKKYLLTKNEFYFYKKLKNVTDRYNLQILAKIRLADLIQINTGMNNSEHMRYWGKIQAKHIDFAIVDDMKVIILVELQDNSHKDSDRIESDNFKKQVLTQCGYQLICTYGEVEAIENAIKQTYNKQTVN
ncbi:MAG: DUF2726 domain-containing protein [Oscillospiraceae bacterium]|nr:DUF2726 domain-containing protein [Oscillospiraceae bacterium]